RPWSFIPRSHFARLNGRPRTKALAGVEDDPVFWIEAADYAHQAAVVRRGFVRGARRPPIQFHLAAFNLVLRIHEQDDTLTLVVIHHCPVRYEEGMAFERQV